MSKRITELQKQTSPQMTDMLAMDRSGNVEAQGISIQQLVNIFNAKTAAGVSGMETVTGTVLPNPTSKPTASAIVGPGTYTQTTGGSITTTALLNILGWSGTTWTLIDEIDSSGLVSQSDYNYGGIFQTVAEANVQIPNTIVNGKSLRDGKRVDIGTAGKYVTYWWVGDLSNGNLVVYNDQTGTKYKSIQLVLNSSVNRAGTIVSDQLIDRTDYLNVSPGDKLIITTGLWQSIVTANDKVVAGFNSAGTFVSVLVDPRIVGGGVDGTPLFIENYELTIPSGINKVLVPVHHNYKDVFKIVYKPKLNIIANSSIKRDGTVFTPDSLFGRVDMLPVHPGDTLLVTTTLWQSLVVANDKVMCAYDSNGQFISVLADPRVIGGGVDNSPFKIVDFPVTIPEAGAFVSFPVDNSFTASVSVTSDGLGKQILLNAAIKSLENTVDALALQSKNTVRIDYNQLFNKGLNIIAHAGGVHLNNPVIAPINSIIAAQNASRMGHKFVEFDCVFTKDEIPVSCHDLYLNDYFVNMNGTAISGTKNIADYTLAELRSLFKEKSSTANNTILIPTIQDFLEESIVGGWMPVVEVKGTGQMNADRAKLLVDMLGAVNKAMIVAFDLNTLIILRTYSKTIPLGYLTQSDVTQVFVNACVNYNMLADVQYTYATDAAIKMCKDASVPLGVWTPTASEAVGLIKRGINIITSDYLPPSVTEVFKSKSIIQSNSTFSDFGNGGNLANGIITLTGAQTITMPDQKLNQYGYYRLRINYKGSITVNVNGVYPRTMTAQSDVWDTIYFSEELGANFNAGLVISGEAQVRFIRFENIEA